MHTSVLIVGAGPIGLACGIELKRKNIPFRIIERGCLVNSIYKYPVNMTFFSTSDRLEIGGVPFISHGAKPTRREALEYYRRVTEAFDLPVQLYESVNHIEKVEEGGFRVETSKGVYTCDKLVMSTGFYSQANEMGVPGEELSKVRHYFDEPHPYVQQRVLIVGAGNSAVDAALETWRCGAEVNMLIRGSALKEGVKYWVRPDIENRIEEGSIKAWFNSELVEIKEKEVLLSTPDGPVTLGNDFVLAMTGYNPDFGLLHDLGLRFEDDKAGTPVYNEATNESNVAGLYLIGVICGGSNTGKWFIENSRVHAERAAKHIAELLT